MSKARLESIIKLILRGLIPLIILVCGVAVFVSDVTGWSIILGLPMIITAMVMLIYTYDEAVSKELKVAQPKFIIFESKFVRCSVCGKETPRVPGEWEEDTICPKCKLLKEKEARGKEAS